MNSRRSAISRCVLLGALALALVFGTGAQLTCMDAVDNLAEVVGADPDILSEFDMPATKGTTVKIVRQQDGAFGHKQDVVERVGETWGSKFRSGKFDPQGDLRFMSLLIGEKGAEFFGYKKISDREMLVPTVEELTARISKMNELLKAAGMDPIAVQYYEQREAVPTLKRYLDEWAENGALPVGQGNEHFHDLSFHVSAIFLPRAVVEHGRSITRSVNDLVKSLQNAFIKSGHYNEAQVTAVKKLIYDLRVRVAAQVDYYTGALPDALADYYALKNGELDLTARRRPLKSIITSAVSGRNLTPRKAIKDIVRNFLDDPMLAMGDQVMHQKMSFEEKQKIAADLPIEALKDFLSGFDDYMIDNIDGYTSPVNVRVEGNKGMRDFRGEDVKVHPVIEDICQQITARREAIASFAAEYCRSHPC